MSFSCRALINTQALANNLAKVKEFAPNSKILAMIKCDAYGHSVAEVAASLENAAAMGLARIEEAIELRELGIKTDLVLMEGVLNSEDLMLAAKHNLQLVIYDFFQIDLIEQADLEKPLQVWLKLDTGMHRLGFLPQDAKEAFARLSQSKKIQQPFICMTHFAKSEEVKDQFTAKQIDDYFKLISTWQVESSLANSAAIMAWPDSHADWVRPGIMLYGISPFPDETGKSRGLQPVMTLASEIISITNLKQGDAIGYGGTFICPKDLTVGVVAAGYGDGYPRYVPNGTPVLVNGTKTQLIGRVSMDMLTVDLTNIANPKIGDPVTLWGDGLPIETIAYWAKTSPYELVTGITQRVPRVKQE